MQTKPKCECEHDIVEPNAGPLSEEPQIFWMYVSLRAQGNSYIGNISNKRLFHFSQKYKDKFVVYLKSRSWWLLPNHYGVVSPHLKNEKRSWYSRSRSWWLLPHHYGDVSLHLKNEKRSWHTSNHRSTVEGHLNYLKSRCPKRQKLMQTLVLSTNSSIQSETNP